MKIYFDLDGTIFDLYNHKNWLESLKKEQSPFAELSMIPDKRLFTKLLNQARKQNTLGVISWLPMEASENFATRCEIDKSVCIEKHLGTEIFDEINYLKYGTPKHLALGRPLTANDVLVDDVVEILEEWERAGGTGVLASKMLEFLIKL